MSNSGSASTKGKQTHNQSLTALANRAKGKAPKKPEPNYVLPEQNTEMVLTVNVDDVESKPQVRKKFRNIDELAITMKNEGQQTPIVVYPLNTEGKFVIQKGERRWRALKKAGIPTIKIIINTKEMNYLDSIASELIENIQREELTPLEVAVALNEFIKEGWSQKEISERLGKSKMYVSSRISLLDIPVCAVRLHDEEICTDIESLNILRRIYSVDENLCEHLCDKARQEGSISRKDLAEIISKLKVTKNRLEAESSELETQSNSPANSENVSLSLMEINDPLAEKDKRGNRADDTAESTQPVDTDQDDEGVGSTGQTINSSEAVENSGDSDASAGNKQNPTDDKLGAVINEEKQWVMAKAHELIIAVTIIGPQEKKKPMRGILMTDRVAVEPSYVWVKTFGAKGKEEIKMYPATHIVINTIEK